MRTSPPSAPPGDWPVFDGALRTDEGCISAAADDFGHIVRRRPRAVLEASSAEDVARLLRHARHAGLRVSPRGQGHSVYGQAQTGDGVVVDLCRLDAIYALGARTATVGAGLLWSELVRRTLTSGLAPPVLTDYLELSVGGTLSVGGVTGTSFRFGAQVDQVEELVVVTGDGDIVTCSEREEPDLFGATLAGLGQVAIIVRATVRLVDVTPAVRVFRLWYPDPGVMTADLRALLFEERFEYLLGIVTPAPEGGCKASIEGVVSGTDAMPDEERLAGLGHLRGREELDIRTGEEWTRRVDEPVAVLQELGLWSSPHPWLDLFVPGSVIDTFLPEVLASPAVEGVGPLRVLLYPLRTSRFRRPLLRLPAEEIVFLTDVLCTAPPGGAATMVEANRFLFERNRSLGGTLYPISAVPLDRADWEGHFGPEWRRLVEAKRRYDPGGILTPGPGIFPPA
ncbi:MAG: FAD-binding protein [Actinomycetota bacterium]|nr:FAD-binding protein [Actinomycetota bacterium]